MTPGVVVTGAPRSDESVLAAFHGLGVATVHEAQSRTGLMSPALRPVVPGSHIAGSAVTVSVAPGDNWMIHVAVEQCAPGDILVVAPTSASEAGYIGDLLATALSTRGVRGVVIDAGCRDAAVLQQMNFPVWSRVVSAEGTVKETLGSVNTPIVCAGRLVSPGDVVIADDDGVVVVPRAAAGAVAQAARQREERESVLRQRYSSGEISLDVGDMRPQLASKGLRYVDYADWAAEEQR